MLRAHRLLLQLPQVQHCTSAAACTDFFASASFSTSAAAQAGKNEAASTSVVVKKDWKAVQLPAAIVNAIPTTTMPGQAFVGDMRSTSGLGMGDGYKTHTDKWLQNGQKSPLEYIQEAEPIKVSGAVVASYGSDDPALGCPVEYINLRGTSYDNPAVCKYTGNKYYSEDWRHSH